MIDWLNTNSGAVQGIAIVVLVLVTAFYGFQTWRQAKASDKMVEATKKLAEEAENQRRDSVRPIIVFRAPASTAPGVSFMLEQLRTIIGGVYRHGMLQIEVVNLGKGPALDLEMMGIPIGALGEGKSIVIGVPAVSAGEWPTEVVLDAEYKDVFRKLKRTRARLRQLPGGNQAERKYEIVETTIEDVG